tara:strand:+ start:1555 stop:2352 length:798 start_codon:yes stop_codon:yes gene_type:complete
MIIQAASDVRRNFRIQASQEAILQTNTDAPGIRERIDRTANEGLVAGQADTHQQLIERYVRNNKIFRISGELRLEQFRREEASDFSNEQAGFPVGQILLMSSQSGRALSPATVSDVGVGDSDREIYRDFDLHSEGSRDTEQEFSDSIEDPNVQLQSPKSNETSLGLCPGDKAQKSITAGELLDGKDEKFVGDLQKVTEIERVLTISVTPLPHANGATENAIEIEAVCPMRDRSVTDSPSGVITQFLLMDQGVNAYLGPYSPAFAC